MSEQQPCLWVCHRCEMIGSADEAERHVEEKGHRVDQLSQEESDGVRAAQHEARMNRLAGLMMIGSMNRD